MERRQSDVEIALLRQDMDELKDSMGKLENSVADLLEAWQTATGMVKFMKWLAGAAVALAILYSYAKDHIK